MNKRILLIEDNPQNRYLASFLMEARGWEMVHAEDGPAGIELAAKSQPALILLDIQLPGMDGYAVARALRADPTLAGIPIVAVTSYALSGDEAKARAAGCTGYVAKPFSPRQLLAKVHEFLD